MRLFPDGIEDHRTQSARFVTSFGNSTSIQAGLIHETLIKSGIALMRANNFRSSIALQETTCAMLDKIRDALLGKDTKVDVFDVFDIFGLDTEFSYDFEHVAVTGIPNDFVRHIPNEGRPSINADGKLYGMVLRRKCNFRVTVLKSETEFDLCKPWPLPITINELDEKRNLLTLATASSVKDAKMTGARLRSTISIDPMLGLNYSWYSSSLTLSEQHISNKDECREMIDAMELLLLADSKRITIAISRFVSASVNRNDFNDSLIDAVIGLENLFGNRSEISFSVSLGVAALLGRTPNDRHNYFSAVKKIYNIRSKIIHGSSTCKENNIRESRDQAIYLLRDCIMEIAKRRPDLAIMAQSERIKSLLLGSRSS